MSKIDITNLNKEQARKLRDFLNSVIDDESTADPIIEEPKAEVKKRGRPKKQKTQDTPAKTSLVESAGKCGRKNTEPNKFISMIEFNGEKKDIDIDRNLWKGIKPTERRKDASLIKINCIGCNKEERVSPSVIFNDPENGPTYRCNKCAKNRR